MEPNREVAASLLNDLGSHEVAALALFGLEPAILGRLIDKALALLELGKHERAESLLIDLSNLMPRSASVAGLLGRCRLERGDVSGADRSFSRAIELLEEGDVAAMASGLRLGRARALLAMNEPQRARIDLEEVSKSEDQRLAEWAARALRALAAEGGPG